MHACSLIAVLLVKMNPKPKRKRQCEDLVVWDQRLLDWDTHRARGALPRTLKDWCTQYDINYSGMQKRVMKWSTKSQTEKDVQVRKDTLRTGCKRLVKGVKFSAVAEKLIAYIHLRKERVKIDKVGLSWLLAGTQWDIWG